MTTGRVVGVVILVLGALAGVFFGFFVGLLFSAAMCMHSGRDIQNPDGSIDEGGEPCPVVVPYLLIGGGAVGGLVIGSIPGAIVSAAAFRRPPAVRT